MAQKVSLADCGHKQVPLKVEAGSKIPCVYQCLFSTDLVYQTSNMEVDCSMSTAEMNLHVQNQGLLSRIQFKAENLRFKETGIARNKMFSLKSTHWIVDFS